MKKFKGFIILSLIVVFLIPDFCSAAPKINLTLDGKEIQSDVAPFVKNNRTYVPIRVISEKLGMKVNYTKEYTYGNSEEVPVITLTDKNGRVITIDDLLIFSSDGITYNDDIEPRIFKNNRTFLPIRYVANALHIDINWNSATSTVELKRNNNEDVYPLYFTMYDDSINCLKTIPSNMSIQFKNGKYIIKGTNTTLQEKYDSIYHSDATLDPINEDLYSEKYLYGNNYFFMDSDGTKITGLSAN